MPMLEVFIHPGCSSEKHALTLIQTVETELPALEIKVRPEPTNQDRISELGIVVLPAFVLDSQLLAVGIPRPEWLVHRIQERNATS